MSSAYHTELRDRICNQHKGDREQLDIVFSSSPRLMVEAPAGCGKTTTMISRIAYLYASGKIPNPKRMFGLTFSINAALMIKRDVAGRLPKLLGVQNSPVAIGERVTVTNYHGFCKGVLRKYGYLVGEGLRRDVNLFQAVGEHEIRKRQDLKMALSSIELSLLQSVETSIKTAALPDSETIRKYNHIVVNKLLPLEYITHNAVILFVLEIFERFLEVRKFLQSYYPFIMVDEFQDTNCIAWELLQAIISDHTQLLFLGDPLQRIYGFIGASPDIMPTATEKFNMTRMTLNKNYRFRDNYEMLKLDANIRTNAATCFMPKIIDTEFANVPAYWGDTQEDEASQVVGKVQSLIQESTDRIAILFRGRNKNAEIIEKKLADGGIPYFYGMFTDEDSDYVDFHNKCQELLIRRFGKAKNVSKKTLMSFSRSIRKAYSLSSNKTVDSLLHLLDALVKKVFVDYADLVPGDKYTLLMDIFENRQLKQAMEYVESQIILSTIHGAKGLEWDYVFLADLERWVFPGYYICRECENKFSEPLNGLCKLPKLLPDSLKYKALDELSVFYVGLTRARKQIYVSASATRLGYDGSEKSSVFSCLASLDGVNLVEADSFAVS